MFSSGPAPLTYALLPCLTVFGLLYPAGLVALAAAAQIVDLMRRWEETTT